MPVGNGITLIVSEKDGFSIWSHSPPVASVDLEWPGLLGGNQLNQGD
jgi:hypothetical protein